MIQKRLPNTEEDREMQSLTLATTGTPILDRKQSLFPGFKTLGARKVKHSSHRPPPRRSQR